MGELKVWRRDGWIATKDLGRIDEDGYFYHGGRADDVIISAGWTMSAVEIEDAMLKHPDVREAARDRRARRAARPGREGVRRRRPRAATTPSSRRSRTSCAQRLSQHEYPRHVEFVAELPKTPAGKVNRKVLRDAKRQKRTMSTEHACEAQLSRRSPRRAWTTCASASASRSAQTAEPWCHEATRDNIRHYAHGIGDDNPLWCDPDYAAKTQLRRHRRAAELPVRHQPHHLGLCRRPAGRPRDVVGRRLELAQARQRNDEITTEA